MIVAIESDRNTDVSDHGLVITSSSQDSCERFSND